MRARRAIALAAGLASLALPAHALEWISDSFQGAVAPLQRTLDIAFGFKNSGDKPVVIRALQTNCDCLQAGTNKTTYDPGEAGVVTARFTVGDRVGTYERSVVVLTDESSAPKRLTVRIEVPDPATLSPTILVWPIGAAAEEKTVEVRPAAGVRIDFAEAFPSNTDFRVRLEQVVPGEHYRLHIAPAGTAAAGNAAIRVKGTTPDGQVVVVSAYANVR